MTDLVSTLAFWLVGALVSVIPAKAPELPPRGNVSVSAPVSVQAGEIVEP